jgi:hypothetical protein
MIGKLQSQFTRMESISQISILLTSDAALVKIMVALIQSLTRSTSMFQTKLLSVKGVGSEERKENNGK